MRIKMPAQLLAICLCFGGGAMAQAKQLELERLFADPALSGATPRALAMAPRPPSMAESLASSLDASSKA